MAVTGFSPLSLLGSTSSWGCFGHQSGASIAALLHLSQNPQAPNGFSGMSQLVVPCQVMMTVSTYLSMKIEPCWALSPCHVGKERGELFYVEVLAGRQALEILLADISASASLLVNVLPSSLLPALAQALVLLHTVALTRMHCSCPQFPHLQKTHTQNTVSKHIFGVSSVYSLISWWQRDGKTALLTSA